MVTSPLGDGRWILMFRKVAIKEAPATVKVVALTNRLAAVSRTTPSDELSA